MKRKDYVYLLQNEYGDQEAFTSLKKAIEREKIYKEINVQTKNIKKIQIL